MNAIGLEKFLPADRACVGVLGGIAESEADGLEAPVVGFKSEQVLLFFYAGGAGVFPAAVTAVFLAGEKHDADRVTRLVADGVEEENTGSIVKKIL